jgi:hypothetical protein
VDSPDSGYASVARPCEQVDEMPGSIRGGEFLDQLSGCQLFNRISALWSQSGTYELCISRITYVKYESERQVRLWPVSEEILTNGTSYGAQSQV